MIICIHKKDALQIMAKNNQQSPNSRIIVVSYKLYIVSLLYNIVELVSMVRSMVFTIYDHLYG